MKHLLLLLALLCLAQRSAAQGGKIYRSLDDYRNDRYETVPDLYLKPPVDEAVFGRFGYKLACTDRETKKTLKETVFAVVGDTLYGLANTYYFGIFLMNRKLRSVSTGPCSAWQEPQPLTTDSGIKYPTFAWTCKPEK